MVKPFVINGVKTFVAGVCTISFFIFYKTIVKFFMSTSLLRKFYAELLSKAFPFMPVDFITALFTNAVF